MRYPKGKVNPYDKFLPDSYGNKIHVGALVAYNRSGEVKKGKVIDVQIKDIRLTTVWRTRADDPNSEPKEVHMDEVSAEIHIEEKETNALSKVKNLTSIIVI